MWKNELRTSLIAIVVVMACILAAASPAAAALKAVSVAKEPISGFPAWYQDTNGMSLAPCQDYNGFCTLVPPFCPPALGPGCIGTAITTTLPINSTNFPLETFYFAATTVMDIGNAHAAKFTQVIALEGSFGGLPPVVLQGNQVTFLRINTRVAGLAGSMQPNATYTVTHPYGSYTFSTDASGIPVKVGGAGQFRALDGCAGAPCDFSLLLPATTTNIGPFLRDANGLHTDPISGNTYIGPGPLSLVPVTGSPTGNNFVRIDGPCVNGNANLCTGVDNTIQLAVFSLSGKMVAMNVNPTAITFPPQQPLATATSGTVTVSNLSQVTPLLTPTVALTGANALAFTIINDTCTGGTLVAAPAAGSTCTFNVVFSSTGDGTKTATAVVTATTPSGTVLSGLVNLSGVIDGTKPFVVSTIPVGNATPVPSNNDISAVFNESVLGVSNATFILSSNSTPTISGAVVYNDAIKTAVFTPTFNLTTGETYTATITTGVHDFAGNPLEKKEWKFVTTLPDVTPPSVTAVTPANNSVGVRTDTVITAVFNEPVDAVSVNNTTFKMSGGITGDVTYDQISYTATFTPHQPLSYYQPYTVTISGVHSLGQVAMVGSKTWTFLTNGAPTAPKLVSPVDGATGQETSVTVQWLKSQDINADVLTYNIFYCDNPFMIGPGGCTTPILVLAKPSMREMFAGIGGIGGGMLLAGMAIIGGVRTRKKVFYLFAVLLISGMTIVSCSGSSDSPPPAPVPDPNLMSQVVPLQSSPALLTNTVYYWFVVADDGRGGLVSSETWSFKTKP